VTDFKEIDLPSARQSVLICGLPFEVTDLDTVVRDVVTIAAGSSNPGLVVRLSNAYSVMRASRDLEYRQLFARPGATLPGGASVACATRIRARHPRKGTWVLGPSFFVAVLDQGRTNALRHFLIGTSDDALTRLVGDATIRYPGVNIVGTFASPPSAAQNTVDRECVERIAEANADIVWIGLDSPEREFAAAALAERLPGVFVDVGADLDSLRPVPTWIEDSGLAWAYRLMFTPRRIRRGHLLGNARFILAVIYGR